MENSECCVGEDVSLTPDATDDSCITQFIEIVPVHISRKDFPNTVQVKDEFTADIKQEPEDLCEVYGASAVNAQVKVEFTADIKQEPEDLCEVYGTSAVNVSLFVLF